MSNHKPKCKFCCRKFHKKVIFNHEKKCSKSEENILGTKIRGDHYDAIKQDDIVATQPAADSGFDRGFRSGKRAAYSELLHHFIEELKNAN